MSATDLVMYRGDDRTFPMALTDNDGPLDLTDATIRFTAKRRVKDDDADAVIALSSPDDVEVTGDPLAGNIRVRIARALTADMTAETKLLWDVQVTKDDESRTVPEPSIAGNTLGTLVIRLDVTRSVP